MNTQDEPRVAGDEPHAFIVKVWKPATVCSGDELKGWVENPDSGETTPFVGLDEMTGIISRSILG